MSQHRLIFFLCNKLIFWFILEINQRIKRFDDWYTRKYFKEKRRQMMSRDNSKKSTSNHKKEDGKFHSKHIHHNPQAESARAVFGLKADNSKEKE